MQTNRRDLLRSALIAAGASVPTGCDSQPDLITDYPVVPENKVKLPDNGCHVLLIGAGLSGLIAACELLDRGFRVTILEKNATPGGRLRAWRDRSFGQPRSDPDWVGYPIEHGTHIVLSFYINFREFLGRHGLQVRERSINDPMAAISFAYPDGTIDDRDATQAPGPIHGAQLLRGLKKLTPQEDASIGLRQAMHMMAFDARDSAQVTYLDSLSLADWARRAGLPEASIEALLDPIMDMANFHPAERTSALYFHRFVSSMLGHWRDLFRVQFFQDSTQESIIEPLERYVLEHGGQIHYNSEVEQLLTEDQRVTAVQTRAMGTQFYVCPICGEIHEAEPERCRRCGWNGGGFIHQSRASETYHADYVLAAVDIPGAKALFGHGHFAADPFFRPIQQLPTSSILVLYLWYPLVEGQGRWSDHFGTRECLMTGGFAHLGTTLNLTVLKAPSYGTCGADVIETQIARMDWLQGKTDAEIADAVDADLRALIPDLPRYTDLRIMRWDNFSTMTVGAEALRPEQQTPYDNLLLLGDYTALQHNCILMEKVNVNVRRAVNHLLEREGIQGGRMTILPSETPNPWVQAVRSMGSVVV